MSNTTTAIRLTEAQRKALKLIADANGGFVRGTIATSTRRWLVAAGLVESISTVTDAGREALASS